MWRTVSFVERIKVDFTGNIFNQAIILGDVDNDKANELAIGNVDGTLSVFKGRGHAAWKTCSDLGMITCVGIGDLFSSGKNHLYCLTAEGWYYAFNVNDHVTEGHESHEEDGDNMIPMMKEHLPPNGKVMLIADVDGDGLTELAIGYSDRVIRLYKWKPAVVGDLEGDHCGSLVQIDKWQCAGQIGSITLNKNKDGKPELLASQPGGTYVTLIHNPKSSLAGTTFKIGDSSCHSNLIYDPLVSSRARNSSISTEIVGNIGKGTGPLREGESEVLYALCTLDGSLVLVENGQILWSLQVDHQLFSLTKLDVTGNGNDEVVCCSWDGQTYIVNHSREVVRYQFEENVVAFTAGYYAINTTDNVPCFVYVTFNYQIYIYYNIKLPRVESTNLIEVMDKKEEMSELLKKLNLEAPSSKQLQGLYHWLLYGWKQTS